MSTVSTVLKNIIRQIMPDYSSESSPTEIPGQQTGLKGSRTSEDPDIIEIDRPNDVPEVSKGPWVDFAPKKATGSRPTYDSNRTNSHLRSHKKSTSSNASTITSDFQRQTKGRTTAYAPPTREPHERRRSPSVRIEPNNEESRHQFEPPRGYTGRKMARRSNSGPKLRDGDANTFDRDTMTPQHDKDLQETIRKLTANNERLMQQIENHHLSFKNTEDDLKARLRRTQSQLEKAKDEFAQCQAYCDTLQNKVDQMDVQKSQERDALLELRTRELSAAQSFLTMADICSGTDVVSMVHRLNAEIMQAAASIADLIEDLPENDLRCLTWDEAIPEEPRAFVCTAIGEDLITLLQQKGRAIREDTFPFQVAIQAILSKWAHDTVNLSHMGDSKIVESLYSRIRQAETQVVSAKWRAITSQVYHGEIAQWSGMYMSPILFGLLGTTGWHDMICEGETGASIQKSLSTIHNLVMEIKATTKQGILSCDLDLVFIQSSVDFDPSTMTDGTSCGTRTLMAKGAILCTVGLGVHKSTVTRNEGGSCELVGQTLLKAEVVLASALSRDEDVTMAE